MAAAPKAHLAWEPIIERKRVISFMEGESRHGWIYCWILVALKVSLSGAFLVVGWVDDFVGERG